MTWIGSVPGPSDCNPVRKPGRLTFVRPTLLTALLVAVSGLGDADDGVEIRLAFPDDPWILRHRVEESAGGARWEVEAEVGYRVLLRHPVEGARVETTIRAARWAGPDGSGERTQDGERSLVFEVAGGG